MTTDITELALLVSKAKASVFTLKYISQFEPADIDSDDVDLRFEVDGRDTGTNVSIVDECGQAAKVIGELVEALEKAQQRIAVLEEAEQKLCAANVTLDARAELAERRLAEMDSRTVTVKLPVSLDFDCEMENGDYDIDEEPYLRGKVDGFNYALTKVRRLNGTAGIKWEAE